MNTFMTVSRKRDYTSFLNPDVRVAYKLLQHHHPIAALSFNRARKIVVWRVESLGLARLLL
jgi:hypothetical protein